MAPFIQTDQAKCLTPTSSVLKSRAEFVHSHLEASEQEIERDDSVESSDDLRDIFARINRARELTELYDGKPILEVDELLDFMNDQTKLLIKSTGGFDEAVTDLDDLRACLNARRIRAAIELLVSIHPVVVQEHAENAANLLRRGWVALRKGCEFPNEAFLDNILFRSLLLEVVAKAAKACSGSTADHYEALLDASSVDSLDKIRQDYVDRLERVEQLRNEKSRLLGMKEKIAARRETSERKKQLEDLFRP